MRTSGERQVLGWEEGRQVGVGHACHGSFSLERGVMVCTPSEKWLGEFSHVVLASEGPKSTHTDYL